MKLLILSLLLASIGHTREWGAHEISLRSQIDKIREIEKKLAELIQAKNKEKDDAKLKPILGEIQTEYKSLEKLFRDLDEEKRHVRFEHPDQGIDIERKYRAYKIRSLEDMENELGTDGRLSRLKAKVFKKYGVPEQEPKAEEPEVASKEAKAPEKPSGPERPKLSY